MDVTVAPGWTSPAGISALAAVSGLIINCVIVPMLARSNRRLEGIEGHLKILNGRVTRAEQKLDDHEKTCSENRRRVDADLRELRSKE